MLFVFIFQQTKKMEKQGVVSLWLFLACSFIYPFLNSVFYEFFMLLFILFLGISYFRFNILYPFVWLASFVFLYNATFCVLDITGLAEIQFSHEILFCTYLSIITLFLFCLVFIRQSGMKFSYSFMTEWRGNMTKKLLVGLIVIMILYLPLFLKAGYTSKKEMNLDGGLPLFGIVSRLFFIIYALYLTYYVHIKGKFPKLIVIASLLITLAIALIIGERDVFLTIGLLTFLVYYYYFKPSFRVVLLLGAIGLVSVAILQATKQITNKDQVILPTENLFEATFGGEFATSGSNLNILMMNKSSWNYQHGEAIINDLQRSFVPDFLSKKDNSSRWFNKMFNAHLESGYGMGFSYLGEGYVQFGYVGVVLWTILLAIIVLCLYRMAQKELYGFITYIYMMGMILYAMRGDLSYVISPLVKQVLLSYLLLIIYFKSGIGKKRFVGANMSASGLLNN